MGNVEEIYLVVRTGEGADSRCSIRLHRVRAHPSEENRISSGRGRTLLETKGNKVFFG